MLAGQVCSQPFVHELTTLVDFTFHVALVFHDGLYEYIYAVLNLTSQLELRQFSKTTSALQGVTVIIYVAFFMRVIENVFVYLHDQYPVLQAPLSFMHMYETIYAPYVLTVLVP